MEQNEELMEKLLADIEGEMANMVTHLHNAYRDRIELTEFNNISPLILGGMMDVLLRYTIFSAPSQEIAINALIAKLNNLAFNKIIKIEDIKFTGETNA